MADKALSACDAAAATATTSIPAQESDTWKKITIPAIVRKRNRITVGASTGRNKDYCDIVCDGTDDHLDIATALGDLPAQGGIVELGDGVFNLSATVTVDGDNVHLVGQGAGERAAGNGDGTRLVAITGFTGTHILDVDNGGATRPVASCHLRDFTLDGGSIGTGLNGIHYCSYRGHVENVRVFECTGDGFTVEGFSGWTCYDTTLWAIQSGNNDGDGIVLAGYATDVHLVHSLSHNNAGSGLHLKANTGGTQITGLHSYDNQLYGVFWDNGGGGFMKLANSKIQNSRRHGLYFDNTTAGFSDIQIANVDLRRNGRGGSSNEYDQVHFNHAVGHGIVRVLMMGIIFAADGMDDTADQYKPGYLVQADGSSVQDIALSNFAAIAGSWKNAGDGLDIWGATRPRVNNLAQGGVAPASSAWNGYGQEGLDYIKTDTNTLYKFANGDWRQLN